MMRKIVFFDIDGTICDDTMAVPERWKRRRKNGKNFHIYKKYQKVTN